MKKDRILLIIFCLSLVSLQLYSNSNTSPTSSNENHSFVNSKLTSYIVIDQINISGNTNLIQFAQDYSLTGNGNENNPILIQNFEIANTSYRSNIELNNTNLFVIIENNLLGDVANPISIVNGTNIKIYNNNISNVYSVIQTGVYVNNSHLITIDSNTIYDWASSGVGIHLQNTWGSIIISNSINTYNQVNNIGIRLDTSSNNTISQNQVTNLGFYGIFLLNNSSYNYIYKNSINLNNINANDIYISNFCNYNSVISNTLTTIDIGVAIGNSFSNNILNNKILSQSYGISLSYATSNNISSNYIENTNSNQKLSSTVGIEVGSSNNNFFLENTIVNEYTGINLVSSYGNIFLESFLTTNILLKYPGGVTNSQGIASSTNSGDNFFNESTIQNFVYGFYFQDPSNILTFNNFINNGYQTSQGYVTGASSTIKYNYWSDFTSPDNNHDGIVDYAYYFPGNNPQNYDPDPLVTMFNSSHISLPVENQTNTVTQTISGQNTVVVVINSTSVPTSNNATSNPNFTKTVTSTKTSDGFIAIPVLLGLGSVLIIRSYKKKNS